MQRIVRVAPLLPPWLLDGVDDPTAERRLARLPAAAYADCTARWIAEHAALDRWVPAPRADATTAAAPLRRPLRPREHDLAIL
ncbi:hypothetical protein AB0M39_06670 [Streptomyces sp. NPDC051907]|uniref:hypothetical protein n=1 Tax=Streptomyces sp. NPDC051907 TaxID=3155284 RepID=UPI003436403E